MAVLKYHSFDEKKIKRYKIGSMVKHGRISNLRTESDIGSYYNALDRGAIFDYNGVNLVVLRIDPYTANMVSSFIENKRKKFSK